MTSGATSATARSRPAGRRCGSGAKWVRRHPASATLVGLGVAAAMIAVAAGLKLDTRRRHTRRIEAQRVADLAARCDQELFKAQASVAEKQWPEARLILTNLLTVLNREAALDPLRRRAALLLVQVDDRLAVEKNLRLFFQRRDDVFFHETRFTGLDLPANLQATRAAARGALGLFARTGPDDAWTLTALPSSLTPRERAEIGEGCYELLLILAEAIAETLPGEDPVIQADRGLRILDQAARLRSEPTRAHALRRAAGLARKGDKVGAAEAQAEAGRLKTETAHDHFLEGQEQYRRGAFSAARQHFDAALRLRPDHFWAQCLAAICAIQTKEHGRAELGLNVCLQREPQFVWLYLLRGFAAGQSAVQARAAGKAPLKADGSSRAGADSSFEVAEAEYRKALELLAHKPNDELRYVLLVNRAVMRSQRGRLDEAVADFQEALRLDPHHYNALAGLAQVFQRQKRWDEAVEQFTRAIAVKPSWAPLYRARAAVQMERGDASPAHRAAALGDLEEAIRYERPGNPVLAADHTGRGELLRQSERPEEALAACDAALLIVPEYDKAHRLRVLVLLDLKRDDEVIRSCDGALEQGKPWADIHEVRGMARARRGDYTGAIADYSQALALRPGRPSVLTLRGRAYLAADSPRLALGDFDEALRLDRSNGEAHGGRGLALARLGDYRGAATAAEESLRHDPASAHRAATAARIYAQAAIAAAQDVTQKGDTAVLLVDRYRDRAVALVKRALELTSADRRAAFWQAELSADPALRPLQRRLRGLQPRGVAHPQGR